MTARKKRSDAGSIQATPRDIFLLTWIGQEFAISMEHLHMLVNAYKGETVSYSNIKWLVDRWHRAGWVHRRKKLTAMPSWVWLTKEGLNQMQLPYGYVDPSVGTLEHVWHTNAVRLWVTTRAKSAVWICGRQANMERKAQGKKHQVDAEVIYDGSRIAIEVELTRKSKPRLNKILKELRRDYDTAWYFLSDDCYYFVTEMINKQPSHEEMFVTYRLQKDVATYLYEQYAVSGEGSAAVS